MPSQEEFLQHQMDETVDAEWSPINVLDGGSVELKSVNGDDLMVVNAARVSNAKMVDKFVSAGTEEATARKRDTGMSPDDSLVAFLHQHQHWTPFGHPQMTFLIRMPVFVARQWMRSNVGICYNEVSRRYVDDEPEYYTPTHWRSRPKGSVKQGSGEEPVDKVEYPVGSGAELTPEDLYEAHIKRCQMFCDSMIKAGVAPEMARIGLPLSHYTEFYMTASLAAMFRIIGLRANIRSSDHAQLETAEYAKACAKLVQVCFPHCYDMYARIIAAAQATAVNYEEMKRKLDEIASVIDLEASVDVDYEQPGGSNKLFTSIKSILEDSDDSQ